MRRIAPALAVGWLVALPLAAGIHYKATNFHQGGTGGQDMRIDVEAFIQGESAKILFTSAEHPIMREGTYLVTTDGGKTIVLVDPEKNTCSPWDVGAMLEFAGDVMDSMGGSVKMEFSDPRVQTLDTRDGGEMLGVPTTYYEYQTDYDMEVRVFGMGGKQSVRSHQKVWTADKWADAGLGVWLRKEPPKTGNEDLDRLMEAEMSKMKGFPLKMVEETTTTNKKGKQSVTRSSMEVFELDERTIDPATFVINPDCEQVQMMPAGEGEGEEEGMKGRFRKMMGKEEG